jgi:endonuclease-3
MTNKEKALIINDYLNRILKDAKCELVYNKPYELVICVMLSAQTTDKSVNKVSPILFSKYPSLEELKDANEEDIKEIIKSIGLASSKARNVKLIAEGLLNKFNGEVPSTREELMTLPGVGRKTANVVLLELYNKPVMAVDTHVERVSKRLGIASKDDSVLDVELKLNKYFLKEDLPHLHHQLIHFGRQICKGQRPLCEECELKEICKYYKSAKK